MSVPGVVGNAEAVVTLLVALGEQDGTGEAVLDLGKAGRRRPAAVAVRGRTRRHWAGDRRAVARAVAGRGPGGAGSVAVAEGMPVGQIVRPTPAREGRVGTGAFLGQAVGGAAGVGGALQDAEDRIMRAV